MQSLGRGGAAKRSSFLELSSDRRRALSGAWRAFVMSRLLVWAGAVVGVFGFGTSAFRELNPAAGDPADSLSGVLLAPADRWDAGWFLAIAEDGYDVGEDSSRAAFFPLYPLAVRIVAEPFDTFDVAGVLVSLVALFVALYLLYRLTELELGTEAAANAVLLLAFFPTAYYFSAIYSESLFLALTIGCVYSARRGWWLRAAVLGGLAAATRSSGVLLVVPLAIMLFQANRENRAGVREAATLLVVPLGLLAYLAYVRLATKFGTLAPLKAQDEWSRELRGPIVGVWGGIKNGGHAVREVLSGASLTDPVSSVRSGLLDFAALMFGAVGVVGALRRLPLAYGAYALAALLFAISFPADELQLTSLPRFVIVFFPIFMWLGLVLTRWRHRTVAFAVSAAGLAFLSAMFASGYWIA
jgi:hypothetical protein